MTHAHFAVQVFTHFVTGFPCAKFIVGMDAFFFCAQFFVFNCQLFGRCNFVVK